MPYNQAARVLFAYFNRPIKDYIRTLKLVSAAGGLNIEEIQQIHSQAAPVHAQAILRHLAEIAPPAHVCAAANRA